MKDKLYIAVLSCLSITLLVSCAGNSNVEFAPPKQDESTAKEDPAVEAQSYPSSIVSSAERLYGDDPGGQHPQYIEAIKKNPNLANNVIYFEFNSTELHPQAREMLSHHSQFLNKFPNIELHLEGHADKQGTAGYNLALGERRALSVKDALKAYSVTGGQISIISYGEERPAQEGDTEEEYSRNRRVEMIYR